MSVWTTAGLIADGTFDDPANARVIYLAVAGLLLLAVLLGVGTWLWWRSSKVEHPVLAPLEVMGTRRWWKSDFNERRRRIEEVRPAHAEGDEPDGDDAVVAEAVDLDHVLVRDDPHTFDDLVDPDAPPLADEAVPAAVAVAADPDHVSTEPQPADEADEPAAEGGPAADDEPAAADEPVGDDEPVADAQPDAEPEPVAAEPEPDVVPDAEPEPEPEPAVVPAARVRSVVIDTAPKPRDTPADLGPEAASSDPTPAPIDPLLRLQSE